MERADRLTIVLSAAALCATIIGTSCSTNARIDDLNARIDDLNESLNARIDDLNESLNARIDDLNESLNARIDDLRAEVAAQFAAVNARVDALQQEVRDLRALAVDVVKAVVPGADAASAGPSGVVGPVP